MLHIEEAQWSLGEGINRCGEETRSFLSIGVTQSLLFCHTFHMCLSHLNTDGVLARATAGSFVSLSCSWNTRALHVILPPRQLSPPPQPRGCSQDCWTLPYQRLLCHGRGMSTEERGGQDGGGSGERRTHTEGGRVTTISTCSRLDTHGPAQHDRGSGGSPIIHTATWKSLNSRFTLVKFYLFPLKNWLFKNTAT